MQVSGEKHAENLNCTIRFCVWLVDCEHVQMTYVDRTINVSNNELLGARNEIEKGDHFLTPPPPPSPHRCTVTCRQMEEDGLLYGSTATPRCPPSPQTCSTTVTSSSPAQTWPQGGATCRARSGSSQRR